METFTNQINVSLSQEMDSMMSIMYSQFNSGISSAIAERVIPQTQNMVSSIFSGNWVTLSPVRHRIIRAIMTEHLGLNVKLEKRNVGLPLI